MEGDPVVTARCTSTHTVDADSSPSRNKISRRTILKASALFGAMAAAAGKSSTAPPSTTAQGSATLAGEWVQPVDVGGTGELTFTADFPFRAIAPHWDGSAEVPAVVELQLSSDGETFSDPIHLGPAHNDAGPPDRDGRTFGQLLSTDPAQTVRYSGRDEAGSIVDIPGLTFTYIDASGGPALGDVATGAPNPSVERPPIISRAAWGADQAYDGWDAAASWWAPEYLGVEHAIVHHSATPSFNDPLTEIRSIHYYHAVTRGWGDIGYNYLVDYYGNVYEGRVGGDNVIGGHAYQYARGSSGICTIGSFNWDTVTPEALAGLIWITAWVTRGLDPLAQKDFHEVPNLPTICGHRDVNNTACPGDMLYAELGQLRGAVADVLAGVSQVDESDLGSPPEGSPGAPSPFGVGDGIAVAASGGLNLRNEASSYGSVINQVPDGTTGTVTLDPYPNEGITWLHIQTSQGSGWANSNYLVDSSASAPPPSGGQFGIGETVTVSTNGLNLRETVGTDGPYLTTLWAGVTGQVLDGPISATGMEWYLLETSVGTGWAAASFLASATSGSASTGDQSLWLSLGQQVYVNTGALNLRSQPGVGASLLGTLNRNNEGSIIDGPELVDGMHWWMIRTGQGDGWAVAHYLGPGAGDPAVGTGLSIGNTVGVNVDGINVREQATLNSPMRVILLRGEFAEVIDGPVQGDGFTWWMLRTARGDGWAVSTYLEAASTALNIGGTARALDAELNLRQAPSLGADVNAMLPAGGFAEVIDDVQGEDGRSWLRVRSSRFGTGWSDKDSLQQM